MICAKYAQYIEDIILILLLLNINKHINSTSSYEDLKQNGRQDNWLLLKKISVSCFCQLKILGILPEQTVL